MEGRPMVAGSVSRVGRLEVEATNIAMFDWMTLNQLAVARKHLWVFETIDAAGHRAFEYVGRSDNWKDVPDPNRPPPTFGLVAADDE